MNLYLVRHGEAKPMTEDPACPLTDRGAQLVGRIAAWGARAQLTVQEIRHSGKKRAEQTADLFAEQLKPAGGVKAVTGMNPMDDVLPVADATDLEEEDVMLVGHLPFLSRLASQLVLRSQSRPLFLFPNAVVVSLSRQEGQWIINWVVVPELIDSD